MAHGRGGAAAPYLRIESLTKHFGVFTALREISLEVEEGEFVCFLGPSGCGKTTLLRAIAGLDVQSAGTIEQAGRDISLLPVAERDFGIVFQSYALFPNLTVTRNVAYGLEGRGTARAAVRARVAELLELVGLPEQGDKYPAQLSGGQQQRVALARAIATSPGLLLLDEPLSALDAKVRARLRLEVKALQRRLGITTIMVTHDQEEALTMADRIVVMNHGVIEQVGTPVDVYVEPSSAFVADFIGTMNFLHGRLESSARVRLGAATLACKPAPGEPGAGVTVALRPEDIEVTPAGDARADAFAARVAGLEFLGSFVRAALDVEAFDGTRVLADVSIHLSRELDMETGGEVAVRIEPERVRVFEEHPPA